MKPHEFWDCTYRDASLFVQSFFRKEVDDFKRQIVLYENFGNKILNAGMTSNNPRNVSLIEEVYDDLFEEELLKSGTKVLKGEELNNFLSDVKKEIEEMRQGHKQ